MQQKETKSVQVSWKAVAMMLAFLLGIGMLGSILRFGWPLGLSGNGQAAHVQSGSATATPLNQARQARPTPTLIGPTPTPDCGLGLAWRIVDSPNLLPQEEDGPLPEVGRPQEEGEKGGNNLADVAALAPDNVWAVGLRHSKESVETLVEHWDGAVWNIVFSRNIGSRSSVLNGVSAAAPDDIWAVGAYTNLDRVTLPLIEHWDGTQWSVTPVELSSKYAVLNRVAAISRNDAWAVGYSTDDRGVYRTLTLHWDGGAWRTVPSPNAGGKLNLLTGISALSATDIWAVGYAVGEKNSYETLIERWDGSAWSLVSSPSPGNVTNYLYSVAAVGEKEAWAVGYTFDGIGPTRPLALRWDGTTWGVAPAPAVQSGYAVLNAVSAVAPDNVWAAGTYQDETGARKSLVSRWDGKGWEQLSSPSNGLSLNVLQGISALSPSDVWAVGYADATHRIASTLTVHYNDPCITRQP